MIPNGHDLARLRQRAQPRRFDHRFRVIPVHMQYRCLHRGRKQLQGLLADYARGRGLIPAGVGGSE